MLAAFLAQLGQLLIGRLQFAQQQLMTLLVVLCSAKVEGKISECTLCIGLASELTSPALPAVHPS